MTRTDLDFTVISESAAVLIVDGKEYVGPPHQVFKDFLLDLRRAMGEDVQEPSSALRRRYTIIDHEDKNTMEVGTSYVLSPAKNPADLAALHTLIENSHPEMASELQAFADMIHAHPDRRLGSIGEKNVAHLTHPKLQEFKAQRLRGQDGK